MVISNFHFLCLHIIPKMTFKNFVFPRNPIEEGIRSKLPYIQKPALVL